MKFKLFYGEPFGEDLEEKINDFIKDKQVRSLRTNIHKDEHDFDEVIVTMLYE